MGDICPPVYFYSYNNLVIKERCHNNFHKLVLYFSFFQGVKAANIEIFKAFYNAEKMEKNNSFVEIIMASFLNMV